MPLGLPEINRLFHAKVSCQWGWLQVDQVRQRRYFEDAADRPGRRAYRELAT